MNLKFGCAVCRAIEESDAALLKLLMNEPSVEATTVGWNPPVSSRMQEEWIQNYRPSSTQIRWMVELLNGTTLGMVMLHSIDWKNGIASIAYKRNPFETQRMSGDMKDAVYAVLRYAFLELNLHRIEARILDFNEASQNLISYMGFSLEGVLHKRIYKDGHYHDERQYGLLREDFAEHSEQTAPWRKQPPAP